MKCLKFDCPSLAGSYEANAGSVKRPYECISCDNTYRITERLNSLKDEPKTHHDESDYGVVGPWFESLAVAQ